MPEIVALAISDIHFHDWKQFNEDNKRLTITIEIITELFREADELGVPIIFSGDLFHTPKGLTTKEIYLFMEMASKLVIRFPGVKFIGISGNHDIDNGYSLYEAICLAFPNTFICIDDKRIPLYRDIYLYGIRYIRRNMGLTDKLKHLAEATASKNILLLHTELYGAPDPSGYIANPQNLPLDINSLFRNFDLVLAGHVHKHTKLTNDIYMVGAPNQQRKSDMDCTMGYLKIYYDLSVEFIELHTPSFRNYNEGETHENTDDFWVEIPKPKKVKKTSEAEFKPTMSKTHMAKRYAKETGTKSPKKINALIKVLNKTDD